MYSVKKITAALTGMLAISGAVAMTDLPIAYNMQVAEAEQVLTFTPRQFVPQRLFEFGPEEFVNKYNKLGMIHEEDMLHAPKGEYKLTNRANATFTRFYFDTDPSYTEIYTIVISGDEPDDIKSALLRTVYMINGQGVSEAADAFEKIIIQGTSEEEGILDETLYITKGEEPNSLKLYCLWG